MHGAQNLARFVVGIIGNVISFGLFLSPVPTFRGILENQDTQGFHPYPYMATTLNCMFWILYGLPFVHPDSTLLLTTNSVGLILELIYISLFFVYTNHNNRIIISILFLAELVMLAVVASLTILCFHTHDQRSMFVGIFCVIVGTIMYAAPLSVMVNVFQTQNVEFLPFWVCFAGLCNGACWTAYGVLIKPDLYILIPNGLGTILSIIQLGVFCHFNNQGANGGGGDVPVNVV